MNSKSLMACLLFFLTLPVLAGCNSKSSNEIVCGGSMNFACPADMYCNTKVDCGGIDRNGVCAFRPTQCKAEINPICGCDGQTYTNPCLAAAKGVSQKEPGECKPPPTKEEDVEDLEDQIDEEPEAGISGE